MEKVQYYQMVGERLRKAMEQLDWNQQKILLKCSERKYTIGQASLSKMLSGSNMQMLQVVQVCDTMGLNVAEILSLDPNTEVRLPDMQKKHSEQIITDARDPAFRGYKGKYSIYFYTTKNENSIHQGTFELQEDSVTHQCMVDFRFKTGEKNELGIDIEKHYSGPAYYSVSMQTIYCEVCSEEIGEKGYLLFHYNFLAYENLECRLISAITVSSGVKHLPTMHKLLMTRTELSADDLEYLCGHLKLNNSEILISENAYREFLRDPKLPEKFFEYFGGREQQAEGFLASAARIPYITFNESLISDSFIPAFDKIKIICLLRKYSASPRYNKISSKAEEIVYNYLKLKKGNETVVNKETKVSKKPR